MDGVQMFVMATLELCVIVLFIRVLFAELELLSLYKGLAKQQERLQRRLDALEGAE